MSRRNKLIIIGASGQGKVCADIALKMNKWDEIAFLDDNSELNKSLGIEVIGSSEDILKFVDDYDIIVGIGNNEVRKKLQTKLESLGASIPVLIHPNAIIGKDVQIYSGTVVMAGAIINCSTTIGKGCIINTGVTIDHDNKIGDFVHISPGANLAGTVKIGELSWIGTGAIVINNINISSNCVIGAGSVVIKDILESGRYVGVPARKIY